MVQKIPEPLIEEIRSQSDIVDVISEYMQLTKRGRNWFGLCPFHGEQTPSFSVSMDKQIYHCFGCGAGGNAITFVMEIEGIAFPEAVVKLGERAGIAVDYAGPVGTVATRNLSPAEANMQEAHAFVTQFYHHLLMNTEEGEPALAYLKGRGFTDEMIEAHQIGYALPSWDALTMLLERQGYDLQEMVACGLIIQREQEDGYFDRFRDRVMFPIRDEHGKVIAFSGRILTNTKQEAKYLNSPESPIFHKSEVLYNLHEARPKIRKQRSVILMEGFMDVLAAVNVGVENAVATMGTSLTDQHIHKLKRLAEKVILCYDGDMAGLEATKRAAQLLQKQKIAIEVALLPDATDPDDYIQTYGKEKFIDQIIDRPQAYMAFIMHYARKDKNFQYENDVLQYVQEVLEALAQNASALERDLYIQQLVSETKISEEALYAEYRKFEHKAQQQVVAQRQTAPQAPLVAPQEHIKQDALLRAERTLLAHMLYDVDIVKKQLNEGNDAPFVHDVYNAVFIKLVGFYEENANADYQRFLEHLADKDMRKIVIGAATAERAPDLVDAEIADSLKQFEKEDVLRQIAEKEHQAKEAERSGEALQAAKIAQEVFMLRKKLSAM